MNRSDAHILLNAARDGLVHPRSSEITEALRATGDLPCAYWDRLRQAEDDAPEMPVVRVFKPVGSWEMKRRSNVRWAGPFDVVVGSGV